MNERKIDLGRSPLLIFGEPGGHVSFLHALNLLMSTFTCNCMCTGFDGCFGAYPIGYDARTLFWLLP